VGHGRAADLSRGEPFGDQLVAGHQPNRQRQRRRPRHGLDQRRHDVEVERPRVDLADVGERRSESQVLEHGCLEPVDRGLVAEQVEHVLLGADRTLDAPQRVAPQQLVDPAKGLQQLLAGVGEPLAQRGRLRGHVVGSPGHDQRGVLGRSFGQPGQCRHHPVAYQLEGQPHLELLDVLREVARGHAHVGVLMAG
jgi:hypothetical protein